MKCNGHAHRRLSDRGRSFRGPLSTDVVTAEANHVAISLKQFMKGNKNSNCGVHYYGLAPLHSKLDNDKLTLTTGNDRVCSHC